VWFLLTALAAIIATALWYVNAPGDKYKLSLLSFIYWGAALMWLVDHVIAYAQEGGEFFEINTDATGLGFSVLLFGLLVWLVVLLVGDPKRVLKRVLKK
jgi:hypothetical protein